MLSINQTVRVWAFTGTWSGEYCWSHQCSRASGEADSYLPGRWDNVFIIPGARLCLSNRTAPLRLCSLAAEVGKAAWDPRAKLLCQFSGQLPFTCKWVLMHFPFVSRTNWGWKQWPLKTKPRHAPLYQTPCEMLNMKSALFVLRIQGCSIF